MAERIACRADAVDDVVPITRTNKWKLEVVQVPITKLKQWNLNPRDNDKAAVKLAALLKEHGIINPLIATPDGVLRAGHTRLKAAVLAGFKEVPVIYIPFESERKAVAFALADNKSSEWATWDEAKLQSIFAETLKVDVRQGSSLQEAAVATGFKSSEIEGINNIANFSRADMVPQMPAAAISHKGEVYKLGKHRLMCGDSSSTADVDRLLAGAKIHLVNTDPPYNVNIVSSGKVGAANVMKANKNFGSGSASGGRMKIHAMNAIRSGSLTNKIVLPTEVKHMKLQGDSSSSIDFHVALKAWFSNIARVLVPGGVFYIWGGYSNLRNYLPILDTTKPDLHFAQIIVWIKSWPVFYANRKDFMGDSELCFYGWKLGAQHRWYGPTNARDVWDIKDPNPPVTDVWRVKKVAHQSVIHLTEKPVELATHALQYSSQAGENVLDLFGGSGSTLIGCEQMNRNAYLMELDTLYCDVIRQRWSDFVYGKNSKWQSLTPVVR